MTRENILFAVIGLLFGYLVAFHLVVYVNQNQPARVASASTADSSGNLPPDHPAVPSNDVKDRQRLQSAAERAAQTARSDPQNFDAQVAAANAYFQAGAFDQAIEYLSRANKLRPDDYDTMVRLGNVYSSAEQFDDAEKWYKAALSKKPDDCDTRSELALTYYLRTPKQTDKAIAELKHSLEINPNHVPSLHNLSLMLIEQKQFAEAEATLARLEKAEPGYEQLPQLREELDKAKRGATTGAGDKAQARTQGD
jgi:tetratricopeptide (TPR) repeat protein